MTWYLRRDDLPKTGRSMTNQRRYREVPRRIAESRDALTADPKHLEPRWAFFDSSIPFLSEPRNPKP